MTLEGRQFLSGLRVPHLHLTRLVGFRQVPTGRGQALAVWTEGDTPDTKSVSLEGEEFLSGLRIPHFHSFVSGSAGQTLAVRAEGHAGDPAGMPPEGEEFLSGLR